MVTFIVEDACLYLFCTFGEFGICIRNKLLLVFVFLLDIMIYVSGHSHSYFWLQHFGDRFRGGHTSGRAGVTEIDEVPSEQ